MASTLSMSRRGAPPTRCSGDAAPPRRSNRLLVKVVETLFGFPPIFRFASAKARQKIVQRGESLGLDFAADIDRLRAVDWETEVAAAVDHEVSFPDYYRQPFHAYEDGNLSLDAALEVTVASKSVHATVMDPSGRALDPEGDAKLRCGYSRCMLTLLGQLGARPVRDVLDVGAATGLSSLELLRSFPAAAVTGVDLSPHFLAVGRHLQRQRQAEGAPAERLTLVHAVAEHTCLPSESFDLVSVCLVLHELPQAASRAVFREAWRLLRPGGAIAIMEMNPESEAFKRILSNPIPFAIFRSTEPYLTDYVALDLGAALQEAGFAAPRQLENSPRHRTVVALKR